MRQNTFRIWAVLLLSQLLLSCSLLYPPDYFNQLVNAANTGDSTTGNSVSPKSITSFSFTYAFNAPVGIAFDIYGVINESAKTISLIVPSGVPLTSLTASFVTTGSTVEVNSTVQTSGTLQNNFSSPVIYTVFAADGSKQDYTVTVSSAINSQTFSATGFQQTFVVPGGVTSILVDAAGAQGSGGTGGGSVGGSGGRVQCSIPVSPGETLYIYVGTQAGFNGGGISGTAGTYGLAGTGGGASDIRQGGSSLTSRVVVAAGGGGGGATSTFAEGFGGGGGGISGIIGNSGNAGAPGNGGTASSGGTGGAGAYGGGNGTDGTLGNGGDGGGGFQGAGGGGGGGYYGGGGGGDAYTGGGGGGGSSLVPNGGITTPAYKTGDGQIIITW